MMLKKVVMGKLNVVLGFRLSSPALPSPWRYFTLALHVLDCHCVSKPCKAFKSSSSKAIHSILTSKFQLYSFY
ncbi:hypothetical protein Peur_060262 [Populus x canadensis]